MDSSRVSSARIDTRTDEPTDGRTNGTRRRNPRGAGCHRPRIFRCIASPFSAYLNDTIVLYERSDIEVRERKALARSCHRELVFPGRVPRLLPFASYPFARSVVRSIAIPRLSPSLSFLSFFFSLFLHHPFTRWSKNLPDGRIFPTLPDLARVVRTTKLLVSTARLYARVSTRLRARSVGQRRLWRRKGKRAWRGGPGMFEAEKSSR